MHEPLSEAISAPAVSGPTGNACRRPGGVTIRPACAHEETRVERQPIRVVPPKRPLDREGIWRSVGASALASGAPLPACERGRGEPLDMSHTRTPGPQKYVGYPKRPNGNATSGSPGRPPRAAPGGPRRRTPQHPRDVTPTKSIPVLRRVRDRLQRREEAEVGQGRFSASAAAPLSRLHRPAVSTTAAAPVIATSQLHHTGRLSSQPAQLAAVATRRRPRQPEHHDGGQPLHAHHVAQATARS
jgi:hypothetical protein